MQSEKVKFLVAARQKWSRVLSKLNLLSIRLPVRSCVAKLLNEY